MVKKKGRKKEEKRLNECVHHSPSHLKIRFFFMLVFKTIKQTNLHLTLKIVVAQAVACSTFV